MTTVLKTSLLVLVCLSTCHGSGWRRKRADVFFVLDTTTSMWIGDFQKQTALVADIVSEMDIGPETTRVGVGLYSEQFHVYIPLDNNYSKKNLIEEIRAAPHLRGDTYLSRAIQGMRQQLDLNRTRPDVPRIGVLFTDGKSTYRTLTYSNATSAKNEGIFVFTVGIGTHVDNTELVEIAGDPKRDFLYNTDNFDTLRGIRPRLSANMAKVSLYQNDKGTCGENSKVDVMFVYNEYALGAGLTASVKRFLSTIATDLRMNPGNVRVGVVSKTCPGGNDIKLGDYVTREEFSQALEQQETGHGIDHMLWDAREHYFDTETGGRTDAKRRLVVIMNSPVEPSKRRNVMEQLFRAKFQGIEVFIIRHGSNYDKAFLEKVATSPEHVLFVDMDQASEPFLKVFCRDI